MGENQHKKSFTDRTISSFVEFIYSKDRKIYRYLFLLLIVGFFLRLIAALNLTVLADDMIEASQSAGIIAAKVLSTSSHPALYFYLTDLTYNIIGYTTLASRLFPLISGVLSILVIFLITQKLFDKKVAIFSALFVTFSGFLIRNTFAEMSLMWLFFLFFGIYLGMIFLDTKKTIFLIFSAMSFGLGFLTKYNAPFYILAFLIYSAIYLKSKKEKVFTKSNILKLILFLAIILLFALPFLTFNYLIYKDKGILDVYFSRVIPLEKTNELYGSLLGQDQTIVGNALTLSNYNNILMPFHADFLIFAFAIFGLLLWFLRKHYLSLIFFSIFLIIPFILQSIGSILAKHFVFMPFLFAIPAGFGLYDLLNRFKNKRVKLFILIVVLVILILNIGVSFHAPHYFLETSPTSQLKSYIVENVNENDLIVFDPRIYTARALWISTPHNTMDILDFQEMINLNNQLPEDQKSPTNVYIIECVPDDCGWGTIKNQPELNDTIESFFTFVHENTNPEKTFQSIEYGGNEFFGEKTKNQEYVIYKLPLALNKNLLKQISRLNSFYFASYLYQDRSRNVYDYEIKSLPDRLLERFSYFIIIVSMFLAFIFFFASIYLAFKKH